MTEFIIIGDAFRSVKSYHNISRADSNMKRISCM